MDYTSLTPAEFAASDVPEEWRYLFGAIHADYRAGSFPRAAGLVAAIAGAAEAAEHHPDIDVRYPDVVRVTLTTHATGGVTTLDAELAGRISALAVAMGAATEAGGQQALEFAIDTMDADRIRPFWQAVLGYVDVGGNLVDPHRSGPSMWFQTMDEPRQERSRFHVDISVPHDEAEERVQTAIEAGGTLVTDRYARAWWVLADADGNEACVCTWQDR